MTRYFGIHTLEGEWHSLLPRYVLLADRVRGKRVLDIGCGTGIGSSMLMEFGAASVNGVDHRPEVLELARVKHAKQGLNFHVMFWEELEFPDNTFDIVLCLDPTAPVTDANLLRDIRRVMVDDGQYICAIETRPHAGMESILPRYGYAQRGRELEVAPSGERVPQLGNLSDYFPRVHSIVQRPRLSYIFDRTDAPSPQTQRRSSGAGDSGLWIGDLDTSAGSSEQTDERSQRWVPTDDQLCDRDGDPAAVELFYCGPSSMAPPTPREVNMPYVGLIDRLREMIGELQHRQQPRHYDQAPAASDNPFERQDVTSEFEPLSPRRSSSTADGDQPPWAALQQQLDHMTQLYEGVRQEMKAIFERTQQELRQRDQYIDQLVDTMHQWRQESAADQPPSPSAPLSSADSEFESQPTSIFRRHATDEELDGLSSSQDSLSHDDTSTAEEESSDDELSHDEPSEVGDDPPRPSDAASNDEATEEAPDLDES